jgi:hypothetical protein
MQGKIDQFIKIRVDELRVKVDS